MHGFRHRALLALVMAIGLGFASGPTLAEQPSGSEELRRQFDEAIRGFLDRMGPAVEEMRAILDVFKAIDSVENYARPEIQPNGDIVIRRKSGAPPWPPSETPVPPPDQTPGGDAGTAGVDAVDL